MVEHNQSQYYGNQYKFNGKELDTSTGMYYYGARYYDPRLSIFISVDPLAEQTFEPYAYVGNNPIMFIDPTGMSKEGWIEQQKDGQVTLTFDPEVCTEEEALAAGYENVTGVFNDKFVANESRDISFNPDGTVTGIELRPSKSIPDSFYGYTEGGIKVITPTFQKGINFKQPGYAIPIGGAFDIIGAREVFGGLLAEYFNSPWAIFAASVIFNKGKNINVNNSIRSYRNLQSLISKGQAPKTIERFDRGKILGEQDHIHFKDGSALNIDGTWKHGSKSLTNKEKKFLQTHGWTLPK